MRNKFFKVLSIMMLVGVMGLRTEVKADVVGEETISSDKECTTMDTLYPDYPVVNISENGAKSDMYKMMLGIFSSTFNGAPEDVVNLISTTSVDENGLTLDGIPEADKEAYNVKNYWTSNGVRMITAENKEVASRNKAVYYIHGGASVMGYSWASQGGVIKRFADDGYKVFVIDYHTTTLTKQNGSNYDYKDLLSEIYRGCMTVLREFKPSSVDVYGDSYGGNGALALAQMLRVQGINLEAYFCPSAWINLTGTTASYSMNASYDDLFSGELLTLTADMYANGTPKTNPLVSPAYGEYGGITSKFLFEVGTTERLLSENIEISEKLRNSGVDAKTVVFYDLMHDAASTPGIGVAEFDKAFDYALEFFNGISTSGSRQNPYWTDYEINYYTLRSAVSSVISNIRSSING